LRLVTIHLEKDRYLPGETIIGKVSIRTDRSFECNRVVLKIVGKERTEHGSGDSKTTDERYHISRVFRIREGGMIPEGLTQVPFSFHLPWRLPPSYQGHFGSIEYTVESVVEVNWALDPRLKESFHVIQQRPAVLPEQIDIGPLAKTSGSLHVHLDSNILRMKRGVRVSFKVSERSRVRGVQVDIMKREEAKCRWHSMKQDSIIDSKFCPISIDDFDIWKDARLGEGGRHYLPFNGDLISVSYLLKVCLDVALSFDPEVIIPLRISDEAPIDDVLDAIESDLGLF